MGVRIMDNVVPEGLIKRQQYEQFLIKKYGNPYVSQNDVSREVDRIASENDETLFRHLFGDRYRYADRGRLDPQAQAYYQRGQLTLRKNIEKSIGEDLKGKVAQHAQRMSIYDKYSGRKAPALKKVQRPEGTVWGTPKAGEKVYEPPDKPKVPSVARERFERGKEDDALYNSLYEKGLVDVDEKGNVALGEYDPEKYKSLETEAKAMGYKPITRHTKARKRWGLDVKESYNVIGFRKTGKQATDTTETPESIRELYRQGKITREEALKKIRATGKYK